MKRIKSIGKAISIIEQHDGPYYIWNRKAPMPNGTHGWDSTIMDKDRKPLVLISVSNDHTFFVACDLTE